MERPILDNAAASIGRSNKPTSPTPLLARLTMTEQTRRDAYLAKFSNGVYDATLRIARGCHIDREGKRSVWLGNPKGPEFGPLTYPGVSFLGDAIEGYLIGRRAEAEELLDKALEFVELAREIREPGRPGETEGWLAGLRATALAFAGYLHRGVIDEAINAEARAEMLKYHLAVGKTYDRVSAEYMTPQLLITEGWAEIRRIAEIFGWKSETSTGRKTPGLFFDALRVAESKDDVVKQVHLRSLQKRVVRHMFQWISQGHHLNAAYALYAVFPKPDGPPTALIEDAWSIMI